MPRRRYAWPSSKLTPDVMHRLHLHAVRTRVPITRTLREAALAYLANASPDVVPDPEPHDMPQGGAVDGGR